MDSAPAGPTSPASRGAVDSCRAPASRVVAEDNGVLEFREVAADAREAVEDAGVAEEEVVVVEEATRAGDSPR